MSASVSMEDAPGSIRLAENALRDAESALSQSMQLLRYRTELHLGAEGALVARLAHSIATQTRGAMDASDRELVDIRTQMGRDAGRLLASASDRVDEAFESVTTTTISTHQDAREGIESFARLIVGLGPQATLQRGFAVARDANDRPIMSQAIATQNQTFLVQFHDGDVRVANLDFDGRNDR